VRIQKIESPTLLTAVNTEANAACREADAASMEEDKDELLAFPNKLRLARVDELAKGN